MDFEEYANGPDQTANAGADPCLRFLFFVFFVVFFFFRMWHQNRFPNLARYYVS